MRRFTASLASLTSCVRVTFGATRVGMPRVLCALAAVAALLTPSSFAALVQDDAPDPSVFATHLTPPATPPGQAGKLPLEAQVQWLRRAAQSGLLEQLDDAALVALFNSLDPHALTRYISEGPNGYASYEFTLLRQERIRGVWPASPDHMLVRLTREPLRIYVKWLPDGAHAGQEVIYDASVRSDALYGHLGGILHVLPLWASLHGMLARAQTNHDLRELGTEYLAQQFIADSRKFDAMGLERSEKIEVKTIAGVRVVAFTFESPDGSPEFYAKKETLGLDLRHSYFRTVESYDDNDRIFERIVFESITPKALPDDTFDPKNPAYRF